MYPNLTLLLIQVMYALAVQDELEHAQRFFLFLLEKNIDTCTLAREM